MRTKTSEKESAVSRPEAILHPVRLRIVLTLQGRQLTPQEIRRHLPGVPQATLYRHINRLVDAGVVEVVEQRQVHGTVERTLALRREQTHMKPEEFATYTPDELAQVFSTFLGGILELFDRYAHNPNRDLGRDHVTMYGEIANVTEEEAAEARRRLRELVQEYAALPPDAGRHRRMLAVFAVPDVGESGESGDTNGKV